MTCYFQEIRYGSPEIAVLTNQKTQTPTLVTSRLQCKSGLFWTFWGDTNELSKPSARSRQRSPSQHPLAHPQDRMHPATIARVVVTVQPPQPPRNHLNHLHRDPGHSRKTYNTDLTPRPISTCHCQRFQRTQLMCRPRRGQDNDRSCVCVCVHLHGPLISRIIQDM